MTLLQIIAAILALGLIALGYFDVNSTMMVLKRKTGVEVNPIFVWLQKQNPYWLWRAVRIIMAIFVAYVLWHYLPIRWSVATLFLACCFWGWVVKHNYDIANANG